jgi:hypothetical protein
VLPFGLPTFAVTHLRRFSSPARSVCYPAKPPPFLAPHGLPHRALPVPKPLELSFVVPVPDHRIRRRTCGQVRRPLHTSLSDPEPFASPLNFQGEHRLRPSLPLLVSITVCRPIVVDVAGFSRRRVRLLAVQFRQFSRPSEQAKVAAVPGC